MQGRLILSGSQPRPGVARNRLLGAVADAVMLVSSKAAVENAIRSLPDLRHRGWRYSLSVLGRVGSLRCG